MLCAVSGTHSASCGMQADVDERWNTASKAPDMGAKSSQSNVFAAAKLDKLSMALLNFCIEVFIEEDFVFSWPNTLSLVRVGPRVGPP